MCWRLTYTEGGRWGGEKQRQVVGGGQRDEKGKETGKEELLLWIKYITVH